jgi:acetate kinase
MQAVLSLNAGSSSLKFALTGVGAAGDFATIAAGRIEGIGTAPHFVARDSGGVVLTERRWAADSGMGHEAFLGLLFDWIEAHLDGDRLIGVGHRVVHGGTAFATPVRVTAAVLEQLEALVALAPLHQPHNIAAIRAAQAARPGLLQIACFDTTFHQSLPPVASRFAIPRALHDEGVRRYGFHGLSYEYVARRLEEIDPVLAGGRIVVAHLGNGASLCAMRKGRSIDTTMGFTTLDGLVMGTRCGTLDAGVILHLLEQKGMSPADIAHMLYDRSGLLGVSGISGDMRDLLDRSETAAREAIELFVYRIARETAALAGALGGLDGFVFTAGIGENAAVVRAMVCERLAWLGVEIDKEANEAGAPVISMGSSRVHVRVMPTDEERMIAIHTFALTGKG